jgi:hypothetical protein
MGGGVFVHAVDCSCMPQIDNMNNQNSPKKKKNKEKKETNSCTAINVIIR